MYKRNNYTDSIAILIFKHNACILVIRLKCFKYEYHKLKNIFSSYNREIIILLT